MAVMQPRENVYVSTQIRNITLREFVCMSVCVRVENIEKALSDFNVFFFYIYEQRTTNFLKIS